MPSRTVVTFHLRREEYPLFLSTLQPDPRLPPEYDSWFKQSARTERTHRFAGLNVRQITIRYYDFLKYANSIGSQPTYAMLNGYAAYAASIAPASGAPGPKPSRPEAPAAPIHLSAARVLDNGATDGKLAFALDLEGGGQLTFIISEQQAGGLANAIIQTMQDGGNETSGTTPA